MITKLTEEQQEIAKDLNETLGVSFDHAWYPYTTEELKNLQKLAHPDEKLPKEVQAAKRSYVKRIIDIKEAEAAFAVKKQDMTHEGATPLAIAQEIYKSIQNSRLRFEPLAGSTINRELAEIARTCEEAGLIGSPIDHPSHQYEAFAKQNEAWEKSMLENGSADSFSKGVDYANFDYQALPLKELAPERMAELRHPDKDYQSGRDVSASAMLGSMMYRSNHGAPDTMSVMLTQQAGDFSDEEMVKAIKDNSFNHIMSDERAAAMLNFYKGNIAKLTERNLDHSFRAACRNAEKKHDAAQLKHCVRTGNAPGLAKLVVKAYTRELNRELADMRVSAMDKLKSMKQSLSQFFADVRSDAKTISKLKVFQRISHATHKESTRNNGAASLSTKPSIVKPKNVVATR